MCCLFGMIDLNHNFSGKQKSKLLHILATACETRGTDATGIAYNSNGRLQVYKRPAPGHQMRFRLPDDVSVVMGHTRMTTQGNARKNFNNHPWAGRTGSTGRRTPWADTGWAFRRGDAECHHGPAFARSPYGARTGTPDPP